MEKVIFVSLLASELGLQRASEVWPEATRFVIGTVDPQLDSSGYVQPGLGDIGDRLFGTIGQ